MTYTPGLARLKRKQKNMRNARRRRRLHGRKPRD